MGFGIEGLNLLREKIADKSTKELGASNPKDFTRERKMGFKKLIYYCLNKMGLCTNMETNNFFDKIDEDKSISAQALLDQRLKLNPKVFTALNDAYLTKFYTGYPDAVKLFKGHILKGIDGSDMEIPNTRMALEKYGMAKNHNSGVARASISVSYDLLNRYIIDGIEDKFRIGEIDMAMKHIARAEAITKPYKSIYIMDRNYVSISFMTYMMQKDVKFLCRLKSNSHYLAETSNMKADDEIVIIKHTKHRLQRSRFNNEELFQAAKKKGFTRVRIIKYPLATGETEYLITNLEDFSCEEIVELYRLRWGIETMYYSLKYKLQIEKFTSSIPTIIKQDFLSSILVYNIVQTTKNETEKSIIQEGYKYEMKINENMAIGLLKNNLILIMLENEDEKRLRMFYGLVAKIHKFKIPIRKGRMFEHKFKNDNNNSINKLKAY